MERALGSEEALANERDPNEMREENEEIVRSRIDEGVQARFSSVFYKNTPNQSGNIESLESADTIGVRFSSIALVKIHPIPIIYSIIIRIF